MNAFHRRNRNYRTDAEYSLELALITHGSLYDIQRETKRLIIPSSLPRASLRKKFDITTRSNSNKLSTHINDLKTRSIFLSSLDVARKKTIVPNTTSYDSFSSNLSEYLNYYFEPSTYIEKYNRLDVLNKFKDLKGTQKTDFVKKFKNCEKSIELKFKSFSMKFYKNNVEVTYIMLPLQFILLFSLLSLEEIILCLAHCYSNDSFNLANIDVITEKIKLDNIDVYDFNNNIKFIWIKDQVIYEVVLSRPVAIFSIKHKNSIFSKFIDKELLIHLYMSDFNKWDEYVLNYLKENKNFRLYFNSFLSKSIFLNNQSIKIERNKDIICHSEHKEQLYGIISENSRNIFIKFYGFMLEHKDNESNKQSLNWKHTLAMLKLSQSVNLSTYINKRVILSPKSSEFIFNEKILDNINHDNIIINKTAVISNINHKVKIINPHLDWQYILNGIVIRRNVYFKDQFINLICNIRSISDVYNFLFNNINEILIMTENSTYH
jgi:hypothetical protein